ncbi:hypothetical protein BDF19DRAFT_422279 [Syncephalis fuscata]|nr:hypothetical protein BDF19DRAFT_422279 [Syncephalis fuscata]
MPTPELLWPSSPLSSVSSPTARHLENASYRRSQSPPRQSQQTMRHQRSFATLLQSAGPGRIPYSTLCHMPSQDDLQNNSGGIKGSRPLSAVATEKLRRIGKNIRFWRRRHTSSEEPKSSGDSLSMSTYAKSSYSAKDGEDRSVRSIGMRWRKFEQVAAYETISNVIDSEHSSYGDCSNCETCLLGQSSCPSVDYRSDSSLFYDLYTDRELDSELFTASFYVCENVTNSCDDFSTPSAEKTPALPYARMARTYSGTHIASSKRDYINSINHNTTLILDPPSHSALQPLYSEKQQQEQQQYYGLAGPSAWDRQPSRLPPLPPSPDSINFFSASAIARMPPPSPLPSSPPPPLPSSPPPSSPHSALPATPLISRSASFKMLRKSLPPTLKSIQPTGLGHQFKLNNSSSTLTPSNSNNNLNAFILSATAGGQKQHKRQVSHSNSLANHRGGSSVTVHEVTCRSAGTSLSGRSMSIDSIMLKSNDTTTATISRNGSVRSAASICSSRRKSIDTTRSSISHSRRRFRAKSVLPAITKKDQHELDRQDQLHYLLRTFLHANHLAVVNITGKVLDIMTGSGVWALEMASEYPTCQVYGVDLLPAQPSSVLPTNCQFRLAISMTALPYQNEEFDYLHHRFVTPHVPRDIQPSYWHECYRVCKHGGLFEVRERDLIMRNVGEIGQQINIWLESTFNLQNTVPPTIQELKHDIKYSGFHILETHEFPIAVGQWAGTMGVSGFAEICSVLEEHREYISNLFALDNGEFDAIIAAWQKEVNCFRTIWLLQVIIARKS